MNFVEHKQELLEFCRLSYFSVCPGGDLHTSEQSITGTAYLDMM